MMKQPIGITPRIIWEGRRMVDLHEAILRYLVEGREIPKEWIMELNELNYKYEFEVHARNISM
jgi:hypothetical protein